MRSIATLSLGTLLFCVFTVVGCGSQQAAIKKPLNYGKADASGLVRTFSGHEYSVFSVAFSPDGRSALSSSYDNTLKLWDLGLPALKPPARAKTPSAVFLPSPGTPGPLGRVRQRISCGH